METDDRIKSIESKLKSIDERNRRVELDKAWETSTNRKIFIVIITYFLIGLYMIYLGVSQPWLNAIVPALGYLLSTLTLSKFKDLWIKSQSN